MKLVANLKLKPLPDQAVALRETLERCNAACNHVSGLAWRSHTFGQFALHKMAYGEVRERFELAAQAAVRCIGKVADAYKSGRKVQRIFRKHSAQPYDDRILRFAHGDVVSIWTVAGRMKIPFVCGERQRKLLATRKGEVDLMLVRGKFYLACVCDVDDPELIKTIDVLGVDFGVVNIAVDSQGRSYTGANVEKVRHRHQSRRRALQKIGSKSAKRALRLASGKQRRFQRHTNHVVSKAIVADAQRGRSALALEDLEGIRDRIQAKRRQRARLHNWGFYELRTLIAYKAKLAGIPVFLVDPRNTSQQCPCCGAIDKANRPSRDLFSCASCGHAGPADHIAARNIRARGLNVMAPQGSTAEAVRSEESCRL